MRLQLGITVVSALVVVIVGILYPKSLGTLFSGVATVAILGFGAAWWLAHSKGSAATRQFFDALRDQLADNGPILSDAQKLATAAQGDKGPFGPGFIVRTPYLSAWDLLVGLAGDHQVSPGVVSEVARLRRKFDHITRWQDYLAQICLLRVREHEADNVVRGALAMMYGQAVTQLNVLAKEAQAMMDGLRKSLPARRKGPRAGQ